MLIVSIMLCVIFGLVYSLTERNLEAESINRLRSATAVHEKKERPSEFDNIPDSADPQHSEASAPPKNTLAEITPDERFEEFRMQFFSLTLDKDGNLISTEGAYYNLDDEDFLNELITLTCDLTQDADFSDDTSHSNNSITQDEDFSGDASRIDSSSLQDQNNNSSNSNTASLDVNTDFPDKISNTPADSSGFHAEKQKIDPPLHEASGTIDKYNLRWLKNDMPDKTVIVFSDITLEKNTLHSLIRTLTAIGIISFIIFLAISILLSRWAVRPVRTAWVRQKEFIADASHELKTPLTVILTNTELLQDPSLSEANRTKSLQSIHTMSVQMKQLVEKLLLLAKSDSQQSSLPMKNLNFSRLVINTALSFEGVFIEKNLMLDSYADPDIIISGNETSLVQLLEILLDNARKYSFPGTETTVRLYRREHGKCILKVSNCGPEIPPCELENIFRRFYRMDKSRSGSIPSRLVASSKSASYDSISANPDEADLRHSDASAHSFGLGLSIAESIVSQHKGRIRAESDSGKNTFIVELHM